MQKPFKPMLAATVEDASALQFPLLVTPKLDGIRCTVRDGIPYSRSNKPIRNRYVQKRVAEHAELLNGLDGELIVGNPTAHDVCRTTTSAVMSIEGEPDFEFFVFDSIRDLSLGYLNRFNQVNTQTLPPFAQKLAFQRVDNLAQLLDFEKAALSKGFEGVILRSLDSPYKQNRSTLREAYLLKLKRFTDAEAVCIGFGELMHNGNEATVNELGHTRRSTAQDGLIPGNTLGYLLCRTQNGIEFKVGTGFDASVRSLLWSERDLLPGRLVKYKSFEIGVKEAPRHPVWLGFRDPSDL